MKTKMKQLMALTLMAATLGMVSCTEKENNPTDTPNPGPTPSGDAAYALHYQNRTLEEGQTIYYTATAEDISDNYIEIALQIENLTNSTLSTSQSVVKTAGPDGFPEAEICAGGNCPWNGEAYSVAPGLYENPIFIHLLPAGFSGQTVKYTITVGEGRALNNPTVAYLEVTM